MPVIHMTMVVPWLELKPWGMIGRTLWRIDFDVTFFFSLKTNKQKQKQSYLNEILYFFVADVVSST